MADGMELAPADRPLVAPGVASAELQGEVIVIDRTGQVLLLNATASVLWNRLDGEAALEQIAADVAAAYGRPYEVTLREVTTLVGELAALGVVAVRSSASGGR